MTRRLNPDPLAVTSSGAVLVNVAHFDGPRRPERMLALACSQPGRLFVGVEVSHSELREVSERVEDSHIEAAAFVAGKRQKRVRRVRY